MREHFWIIKLQYETGKCNFQLLLLLIDEISRRVTGVSILHKGDLWHYPNLRLPMFFKKHSWLQKTKLRCTLDNYFWLPPFINSMHAG